VLFCSSSTFRQFFNIKFSGEIKNQMVVFQTKVHLRNIY